MRQPQDGHWTARSNSYQRTLNKDSQHGEQSASGARIKFHTSPTLASGPGRQETPQIPDFDIDQEVVSRNLDARNLQAKRSARVTQIEQDSTLIQNLVNNGSLSSPYSNEAKLITPYGENVINNGIKEACQREEERMARCQERVNKRRDRNAQNARFDMDLALQDMQYFWLSQIDIVDGYWATPWSSKMKGLTFESTVGAICIAFEAILGFLDADAIVYLSLLPYSPNLPPGSSLNLITATRFLESGGCSYRAMPTMPVGGLSPMESIAP